MEPSFWSWEKRPARTSTSTLATPRNGAQLLELGKASASRQDSWPCHPRNGAQLLELGKAG